MSKTSSYVLLALGLIAFLGNVAFMYLLFSVGAALNQFAAANPTEIPNAGVPVVETQQFARQMLFYVNLGWLWAISVLVVSLSIIYYSAQDLMKKPVKGKK